MESRTSELSSDLEMIEPLPEESNDPLRLWLLRDLHEEASESYVKLSFSVVVPLGSLRLDLLPGLVSKFLRMSSRFVHLSIFSSDIVLHRIGEGVKSLSAVVQDLLEELDQVDQESLDFAGFEDVHSKILRVSKSVPGISTQTMLVRSR